MANNLPAMLNSEAIKNRLNEVFGKNAGAVKSALLSIYNGNKQLQECDERSILGAVGFAGVLNLSITPSLGQAYIVPYKGKAQFQVGVRGYVQLAHRTGKYVALHAGKIYEGELSGFNPFTGEPERGGKISDEVVGYGAYMELTNGFHKFIYMTKAEIEAHAEKYSQSYRTDKNKGWNSSPWSTNFDAMANKTVLKKLLNTWGILSAEMAEALQGDQSVVDKDTFTYVDNGGNVQTRDGIYTHDDAPAIAEPEPTIDADFVDADTGEVVEQPQEAASNG